MGGDCSHGIRRLLLLGRKAMKNLGSVLKSKTITADKGPYSQSYGDFPGGQDAKTTPSNAGVWVQSLVGELRSHMP